MIAEFIFFLGQSWEAKSGKYDRERSETGSQIVLYSNLVPPSPCTVIETFVGAHASSPVLLFARTPLAVPA